MVGVQIETGANAAIPWLAPGSAVFASLSWSDIERSPGVYTWDVHDAFLLALPPGTPLYLQTRTTPEWCRIYDSISAPPTMGAYGKYAAFLVHAARRYKPRGLAIYNEPDMRPGDPSLQRLVGSWIDPNDPESSGRAYGIFCARIYSVIKPTLRSVTIIGGQLAYADETQRAFAVGIADVHKLAKRHRRRIFDALGFHCYVNMEPVIDTTKPSRTALELGQLFRGSPLWLTETALLSQVMSDAFEQAQSEYFRSLLIVQLWRAFFWYTLAANGWMMSDLVYKGSPTLAYNDYIQAIREG